MSEVLFSVLHDGKTPIAEPAFRILAAIDGSLGDPELAGRFAAIAEAFLDRYEPALAFASLPGKNRRPAKPKALSAAVAKSVRTRIIGRFADGAGLRLYGPDTGPLGKPSLPFLSVRGAFPSIILLELAVPAEDTDLADPIDAALRDLPVRVGMMGLGFFQSPMSGLDDDCLPPAHRRYKAAWMTRWDRHPHTFIWSRPWDQKVGGYEAGLPDMAWRTYVGREFASRVGTPRAQEGLDVELMANGGQVITAGPAPIWGDVNGGEDTSALRAAFTLLKPAFCSPSVLRPATLGGVPSFDPSRADVVNSYLERFL